MLAIVGMLQRASAQLCHAQRLGRVRHLRLPALARQRVPAVIAQAKSLNTGAAPAQELCVIVDENNQVVGAEPRDVTVRNRLLGRGAYVLVFNSQGDLFVSKRSNNKDVYPGHLDVLVAGVVQYGEEYADTAVRELAEEIGVSEAAARTNLRPLCVFPYQDSSCHVFGCAFTFSHHGGVRLQESEVEWGSFKPMDEVMRMLETERFTPVGRHVLRLYLEQSERV